SVDRHAALWVETIGEDDARLSIGASDRELTDLQKSLEEAKLIPRTLHALRGADGRLRYSAVWGKTHSAAVTAASIRDLFEGNFAVEQVKRGDQWLIDVVVSAAGRPQTVAERARAALERAETALKAKPDDVEARSARASAHLRVGASQK